MITYYSKEEEEFLNNHPELDYRPKHSLKSTIIKVFVAILIPIILLFIDSIFGMQSLSVGSFGIFAIPIVIFIVFIISKIKKNYYTKRIQKILDFLWYLVIVSVICMGFLGYSILYEVVSVPKVNSGIMKAKTIFTIISSQLEDENIEILEDEYFCIDNNYPYINIDNKIIDLKDFFIQNYNHDVYFVISFEDNQLQYVLYSNNPIKDNQIRKYSKDEQFELYKNLFKQHISCYPYVD